MSLNKVTYISFLIVQASAVTVLFVPFQWSVVALWAISHFLRALGLTIAFHYYYAHRAFKMNRLARFFWTLIGTASLQKWPLWWAGHHVNHHRFSDKEGDPHSPSFSGFYHAHIGWLLDDLRNGDLPSSNPIIRDFSVYPEIKWLERYHLVPPVLLAVVLYLFGGFQWLAWGFCLPTVTLAHATYAINTINHLYGSRRFETLDDSRNNALTAFFVVGERWHNNHHRYQRAAKNFFIGGNLIRLTMSSA